MKIYQNRADSIIWDVFPSEFTANGSFETFIQRLKSGSFCQLIEEERERVLPFLKSWGHLLSKVAPLPIEDFFLKTPELSGVLYFSHSTVLSESFFRPSSDQITHPTDRVIAEEALSSLPSAKDLTFSFPRKYEFNGFYNSWGFVRVERSDDHGNDAGIALSVVTLDSEIMDLLRRHQFQHLAHLYNQCWNGSIHDYIHHLALYTNPSFGIGKRSPMSLVGLHQEIDQWGEDMVDTFNYEYWAHRTHRLITERMPELKPDQMILDAKNYFSEVAHFQRVLLGKGVQREYIQRVGEYLGSIYLWPLHILIHPYGAAMEAIAPSIDLLDLPEKEDRILEAASLLSGKRCPQDSRLNEYRNGAFAAKPFLDLLSELDDTPLLKGISVAIKALELNGPKRPFTQSEWLRFKTAVTVQRGMYNCWDHQHPVIFQKKPTDPLLVFAHFFEILKKTWAAYQPSIGMSYELSGICP